MRGAAVSSGDRPWFALSAPGGTWRRYGAFAVTQAEREVVFAFDPVRSPVGVDVSPDGGSGRQDPKALSPGCLEQPAVQADKGLLGRILFAPQQGGRELERVGSPEGVHREKAPRSTPNLFARCDGINVLDQGIQSIQGRLQGLARQGILAVAPVDRRLTLNRTRPPDRWLSVGGEGRGDLSRPRFWQEKGHEG
jgi:hypothetical protein